MPMSQVQEVLLSLIFCCWVTASDIAYPYPSHINSFNFSPLCLHLCKMRNDNLLIYPFEDSWYSQMTMEMTFPLV